MTSDAQIPALTAFGLRCFVNDGGVRRCILDDVTLELWPGTVTALHGELDDARGALLRCLAGVLDPDHGTIFVGPHRLSPPPPGGSSAEQDAARHAIAAVPRQSGLLTHLTLGENLALTQRTARRTDLPEPADLLGQVGLTEHAHSPLSDLSCADLARARLAVALATAPSVLIVDTADGWAAEKDLLTMLEKAAATGIAVLIASASSAASAMADRSYVLVNGRCVPR